MAENNYVPNMNPVDGVHCFHCGLDFKVSKLDTDGYSNLLSDDEIELTPEVCPVCGWYLDLSKWCWLNNEFEKSNSRK